MLIGLFFSEQDHLLSTFQYFKQWYISDESYPESKLITIHMNQVRTIGLLTTNVINEY